MAKRKVATVATEETEEIEEEVAEEIVDIGDLDGDNIDVDHDYKEPVDPPQPEYFQFDPVDSGALVFYHTQDNISFNDYRAMIPRNRLLSRRDIHNPASLCARGALIEVTFDDPVDLSEVPGWQKRAVDLQKHGLTHVAQMLFYEAKQIAQVLDTTAREVAQWQNELFEYLERLVCKPERS